MIITQSSLSCFMRCRQAYKWRYIDGIIPTARNKALDFGAAMHRALESYWDLIDSGEDPKLTDTGLDDPFEAAKLEGLFAGYCEKWLTEDRNGYRVISVEQEFNVLSKNLALPRVNLVGKVDGVVQDVESGWYYILEHKTASIVDDDYREQKALDEQTKLYALAISHTLDIPIAGAIHDIIVKQKIRQKRGESAADFCERLRADVTDDNFVRIYIHFADGELDAFAMELDEQVRDVAQCECYYKCTGACIGRYGACEYMPLCRAGSIESPDIRDMYETRRAHEEISKETIGE